MRPPASGSPEAAHRGRKFSITSFHATESVASTATGGPMKDFWLASEEDMQTDLGVASMPTSTPLTPHPLTPTNESSPGTTGWIPGTPKSMSLGSSIRLSDDGEESAGYRGENSHLQSSGAPELVMPSLAMPDRRPFTERGKNMGRLKICVASRKGVGKTSLIRAIVRQCEDIVQVDPLATTPSYAISKAARKSRTRKSGSSSQVTEIMASTKTYPQWWTGSVKENSFSRRRRSSGESVLERNICFIDTPGFEVGDDHQPGLSVTGEPLGSVVDYVEEQLWRTETLADINDSERLNMISGRGAFLVDVVLFLFSDDQHLQEELAMFLRLSSLTNVVPLVSKADLLSSEDIVTFKAKVIQGLNSVKGSVQPFLFGKTTQDLLERLTSADSSDESAIIDTIEKQIATAIKSEQGNDGAVTRDSFPPFAISSLQGSDSSEMDASLLMSSIYSAPLVKSELPILIDHLFKPENMLWLRHTAALKFISWRENQITALTSSLKDNSLNSSGARALVRRHTEDVRISNTIPPALTTSGTSLLAQMRDSERAHWLLERINEEVARGSIGVLAQPTNVHPLANIDQRRHTDVPQPYTARREQPQSRRKLDRGDIAAWARKGGRTRVVEIDPSDPLGLIRIWEGWGRTVAWSVGGGVFAGAVWVVVIRGWVNGWISGSRTWVW